MGKRQAWGLVVLRLCLGVFFLFQALGKVGWFASSSVLRSRFSEWVGNVGPLSRAYLEAVCIPGVEAFARLVPIGEFAVATAFLLGGYTRAAAAMALLMVLNFHFASGVMFQQLPDEWLRPPSAWRPARAGDGRCGAATEREEVGQCLQPRTWCGCPFRRGG